MTHPERADFKVPLRVVADDEQPRYRCAICQDSPWIVVLNENGLSLARSWGDEWPDNWTTILNQREYHATLRCSCWNSSKAVVRRGRVLEGTYDPNLHCVWTPYDDRSLCRWLENYVPGTSQQEAF